MLGTLPDPPHPLSHPSINWHMCFLSSVSGSNKVIEPEEGSWGPLLPDAADQGQGQPALAWGGWGASSSHGWAVSEPSWMAGRHGDARGLVTRSDRSARSMCE